MFKSYLFVRKDMDVNEYDSQTIKYYTYTHIKVKEQCFYCCSTFQSCSRIFNNENNSYLKM